jgi:DNA-binding NarL/FixJ family response regulator
VIEARGPTKRSGGILAVGHSTTGGHRIGWRTNGREQLRELLSPREVDVVRALARGRTNAEIAAELFVSLSTVKTHVSNVHTKLATRNRVELAVWAWEQGLVR